MGKKIIRNSVVFLSFIFASCANQNSDQPPQIRIVDLQGKPRSVVTKMPERNAQAIASQGRQMQMMQQPSENYQVALQNPAQNSAVATPVGKPVEADDYGAVIQKTIQPQQNQKTNQPPQMQLAQANSNDSILGASTPQNSSQEVEYDLAQDYESAKSEGEKTAKSAKVETKKSRVEKNKMKVGKVVSLEKSGKETIKTDSKGKRFFVQVGSFSNIESAQQTLNKMQKFHRGKVETIEGEKTIYRVLLGPISNRAKTNEMVSRIKDSGHDAILVKF